MNILGQPPLGPKVKPCISPALRENARGQPCTLRLPICNGNWDTTVLCHIRRYGWGGIGGKPHDFLAVFACSTCHAAMGSRRPEEPIGDDDILRAFGETLTRQYEAALAHFGK